MNSSCRFSDLPDLVSSLPSSVSVSDCEDNMTSASYVSAFKNNCSLGMSCDPVSIPVPSDDDELDNIKPVETINVKSSNEIFETAYPPISYVLAPETCALNLLSPVDVCVIASTCVVSHDCWQETACLRRHLDLTRGWLGDYFFSSRVQLSFLPNQQKSVYVCLSCNSRFRYLSDAFKCACQRSPSDCFEGLKSFFSVISSTLDNVADALPCLRCGQFAGDVNEYTFAEIAHRSIYGIQDCLHGPFCRSCSRRLSNSTLAFCPGCRALLGHISDFDEESCAEQNMTPGLVSHVNCGTDEHSRVEQNVSAQLVLQNASTPPVTPRASNASGGFSSENYSEFVPGDTSHSFFGLKPLSLPASVLCPPSFNLRIQQSEDTEAVCECCNRVSTLPDEFFHPDTCWGSSSDASDMSFLCRDYRKDPGRCPVCNQTFILSDLSDVPSPYNKHLSRFFDYACSQITSEEYLLLCKEMDH
jgi:hypothetical protein